MRAWLVLGGLLLSIVGAQAQWLNYPTPGLPRAKDGKPNLTARRRGRPTANRISPVCGMWNRHRSPR